MIETNGFLTVAEAAKRLHRSTEQIRRNLREGKIRGQRIGNQWFVDPADVQPQDEELRPLVPKELLEELRRSREETFKRNGIVFDLVADVQAAREGF
jgi:excisionase family DNA binding protein